MYATQQTIDGDIIVDDVSALNLYLQTDSTYTGAINSDGQAGDVFVSLTDGATWTLTGDSYITSLTCDADSIDLNGYTLYVNGEEYSEGTASDGEAIELTSPSAGASDGMPEGGAPGEKPDGEAPDGAPSGEAPTGKPGDGKEPPADGNGGGEKPSGKPDSKAGSSSDSN